MKKNKKLAEALVKAKGPEEGTKEWLKKQLGRGSAPGLGERPDGEEEDEKKRKKKELFKKLRGYGGQGELREPGDEKALV